MSINQKLKELYASHWKELQENIKTLDVNAYTNPLLLSVDEEKLNSADITVMIFGQETKGWGKIFPDVEGPMKFYDSFFCQEQFYGGYGKSSFWKGFRFFQKALQNENKSHYFIWNNINKIGKPNGRTGVNPRTRQVERDFFSVIAEEIKIIKPDIVIFFTGPYRDADIAHHFPNVTFVQTNSGIKTRALANVKHADLPASCVRMYHPTFFGGFNKYRNQALNEILENYNN
ncbi:hypothetical protein [Marinicellulosiphila megalodicopiae]|uniref:hypothetical protein n=1 Tax=Marinicellulosiphila megalodicopiae TaxID=2724896 RepID=UPI003BB1DD9D